MMNHVPCITRCLVSMLVCVTWAAALVAFKMNGENDLSADITRRESSSLRPYHDSCNNEIANKLRNTDPSRPSHSVGVAESQAL